MSEFRPAGDFDKYREAHRASDVDADRTSLHHTLGKGTTQAAPGNHKHDGVYADLVHNHVIADVTGLTAALTSKMDDGEAAGGDLAGTYPNPTIGLLKVTAAHVAAANKDGTAATPSMRTLGLTAIQAAAGDHKHNNNNPVEVFCTANTVINSTTDTDITGLTTVVGVGSTTERYEVEVWLDITATTPGAGVFFGRVLIDGVIYTAAAGDELIFAGKAAGDRMTLYYKWQNITGLSVANHTFKIQGDSNAATATYTVNTPRSKMSVKKVSPIG